MNQRHDSKINVTRQDKIACSYYVMLKGLWCITAQELQFCVKISLVNVSKSAEKHGFFPINTSYFLKKFLMESFGFSYVEYGIAVELTGSELINRLLESAVGSILNCVYSYEFNSSLVKSQVTFANSFSYYLFIQR